MLLRGWPLIDVCMHELTRATGHPIAGSINETNPSLNFGDDATENLLHALCNIREVIICKSLELALMHKLLKCWAYCLAGQQHFRLVKFELMRLYEIQHSLRQLSYFDVPGRLKLTMKLARLTIALPINVDKAIMVGGGVVTYAK